VCIFDPKLAVNSFLFRRADQAQSAPRNGHFAIGTVRFTPQFVCPPVNFGVPLRVVALAAMIKVDGTNIGIGEHEPNPVGVTVAPTSHGAVIGVPS
jgi:hypothetical protein